MAEDKKKAPAKKADTKKVDPALQAYMNSFENILVNWQIRVSPAMRGYIEKAAKEQWSTTQFVLEFRKTKAYAQKFPGIMRKDGTLRMSESQYMTGYRSAQDAAGAVGRNFSPQMYGVALANNNSPSEIKAKINAVDRLKQYAPELQEYNQYLLQTGQIKKPLERKDLLEFTMGQRKDLELGWQTAHAAFQMQEQAGLDVGKKGDLAHKELQGLIKRFTALGGDIEQVDFKKMGALINDVIPKSDLYGAGITKRNIVDMMLEGKNGPEIAKRTQQILDTYQAAVTEPSAQAPTYAGKVSLGRPNRGSE